MAISRLNSPGTARNAIIVVQGAQWGSEAKGQICAYLCKERSVDIAIRTGTVNAGHTVYRDGSDIPCKMQQLPTAWVNPNTMMYIGPGAFIHPGILEDEIATIKKATGEDITKRLIIDHRAGLHLPSHTELATVAGRHHLMGATGKGCSEAVMSKIRDRGTSGSLFVDWMKRNAPEWPGLSGVRFDDTVRLANSAFDQGGQILIEGTQGTFLDLHLGPYPYTTHKQTQVANWLAEAGLSASLPIEVILVARTYPIRVAGNSGPMPHEISWGDLARRINRQLEFHALAPRVKEDSIRQFEEACREVANEYWKTRGAGGQSLDLRQPNMWKIESWHQKMREDHRGFVSELHATAISMLPGPVVQDLSRLFELTTVTRKLRRIAIFDRDMMGESVMLNRPSSIVLTFANYWWPNLWDSTRPDIGDEMRDRLAQMTRDFDTPISHFTTGPRQEHVIPCR